MRYSAGVVFHEDAALGFPGNPSYFSSYVLMGIRGIVSEDVVKQRDGWHGRMQEASRVRCGFS